MAAPLAEPFPHPVPMGWFTVGFSGEFQPGAVERRRYAGSELLVWRDDDGTAHVWDAYCPHLGADLGVGGTVEDGCVTCPFHGWRFGPDGSNVEIPYSDRPNGRAKVRAYPTVERFGAVLFWYHPDPSEAPRWDVPVIEELEDKEFGDLTEWVVGAAWQEIAENAFDVAHFVSVHGLSEIGSLGDVEWDGPIRRSRIENTYNTKRGPFQGWQESVSYGPGVGTTHFHIFGDAYLLAMMSPIERDRTHARFLWAYGEDEVSQKTGSRFAAEVKRQFEQDIPIWEAKRYQSRPALAPIEKPITTFRSWASQFYAEPSA